MNLPSLISIKVKLLAAAQDGPDVATKLLELFSRKPGTAEVRLRLEKPRDFSVIMDVPLRVRPDKEFKAELAQICGPDCMEIMAM